MNKEKLPSYWSFFVEDMMAYLAIPTNEGRGEVLAEAITYFLNKGSGIKQKEVSFKNSAQMFAYAKSIRDIDRSYDYFRNRQRVGYRNKVGAFADEDVPGTVCQDDSTPSVPYEEMEMKDKIQYQLDRLNEKRKGKGE